VHGGDLIAELSERMPHAGRVRAAGDEAADLPARGDQILAADVLFDPRSQRSALHTEIVTA